MACADIRSIKRDLPLYIFVTLCYDNNEDTTSGLKE